MRSDLDPGILGNLAARLGNAGYHLMAFDILSRVQAGNPSQQVVGGLTAYDQLAALKGKDAAWAWFLSTMKPNEVDALPVIAFQLDYDDILWRIPDPSNQEKEEWSSAISSGEPC